MHPRQRIPETGAVEAVPEGAVPEEGRQEQGVAEAARPGVEPAVAALRVVEAVKA